MTKTQAMGAGVLLAASLMTGCATTEYGAASNAVAVGGNTAATERASKWFEERRDRPTMLRAFLQRMPKGGDIHTHASGATYAESFIEWSAEADLCVDPTSGAINEDDTVPCETGLVPITNALDDGEFYNGLIDKLSVRNLEFAGQSGHDQFFESFDKFGGGEKGDQIAEIVSRAASQHISYVEVMTTIHWPVVALGAQVGFDGDFAGTRDKLIAAGLVDQVSDGTAFINEIEARVDDVLRCKSANPEPGCAVTRRYLQQNIRLLPADRLYAQLVYAFELVRADPRVVGMNLVAPEDHRVALRDYGIQMAMFGYLTETYPDVPVSLHAGELKLGLVPPRHLRSHIRQAVEVAGASRIGHGVGIAYEDNPFELMESMKSRDVLVEICLSSNDVILGVKGAEHPFPDYLEAGVPVTLATDDEGVSRIDLTNEYVRAATTYDLEYKQLKDLARNSVGYSFASGERLDAEPACARPYPTDTDVPNETCQAFLNANEKARLQWRLEREFDSFETLPWFSL